MFCSLNMTSKDFHETYGPAITDAYEAAESRVK